MYSEVAIRLDICFRCLSLFLDFSTATDTADAIAVGKLLPGLQFLEIDLGSHSLLIFSAGFFLQ